MYNYLLLRFKILFSIYPKMKIRNLTTMLQIFPGENLQWKGEDLQFCKPSPSAMLQIFRGEGLQCCRSSGGKFARGKVCNTTPGLLQPLDLRSPSYWTEHSELWGMSLNMFIYIFITLHVCVMDFMTLFALVGCWSSVSIKKIIYKL